LVGLGEIVMILELHRQGVSVSSIARQVGLDRKTVHKYIERGLEPPLYGPRPPRASKIAPFSRYLCERLAAFPQLTGRRLHRELRDLGYTGAYSILTDFLRDIRPIEPAPFEVRFETPPGRQAQVDFAHFCTVFADEPGSSGCSRWCSATAELRAAPGPADSPALSRRRVRGRGRRREAATMTASSSVSGACWCAARCLRAPPLPGNSSMDEMGSERPCNLGGARPCSMLAAHSHRASMPRRSTRSPASGYR
jgi:hypothetical protein